jgi:hypothetical protein
MSEGYRRDLELAPGAGFRLRRRFTARLFSALLALAALGWGALDLSIGYRWVGVATIALAAAFVVQLAYSELESWRFDGGLVHRSFRPFHFPFHFEEERLPLRRIRGVQVAFAGRRARAWVELTDGDEVPLVEGDEREVRRIADRLALLVADRPEVLH